MSKWKNRFAFFEIRGRRFGAEISRVEHGGLPYLDRYILYIGGPTLRLHKFWRGDDDRAPHDHPWAFWTIPTRDYWEHTYLDDGTWYWNLVKAWRVNYRPAKYRHIVIGAADLGPRGKTMFQVSRKPFWTFVVSGSYERRWGFWPRMPNKAPEFVPWREWPASAEQVDLLKQRPYR